MFSAEHPHLTLADIQQGLGVPKSTAHGIAITLRAAGYLVFEPNTRSYTLGPRVLDRATVLLSTHDVARVAEPYVRALRDATHENAHLGVEHDGSVVYLIRAEADASLGIRSDVGKRVPMHCTAMGKALLASLDDNLVRSFVKERGLRAETTKTIVDVEQLLADLAATRARGYAFEMEEYQLGGACVGASIRGPGGDGAAAISVSVPTVRLDDERRGFVIERVLGAADEITGALQGRTGMRGRR